VVPAVQQRPRLAREDERLGRAQPGAPLDPLAHELVIRLTPGARCVDEPDRVPRDVLGNDNLADQLLNLEDVGTRQHARRHEHVDPCRPRHDADLFVLGEVRQRDVEHEAIELGLRQRVRALELDRILRREHEERAIELVRATRCGDVILLHRLEERSLRLRRCAVDLVGQNDLREDWPGDEAQHAVPVLLVEHLSAGDVSRHEIGRELDPLEREIQDLRDRFDQQRLRETGNASQQAVPAREKGHQDLVDHFVLAHDDFADFGEDALAAESHALGNSREVSLG
jgi:hypothetical protein